uniref:C2H2-type domain-containing protein n=1 Tax=Ditylenchus dipsaci TaxID=166011 RepID=A0A915DHI9_9BILA
MQDGRGREYSTKEWNPELPSFLVKESYEAEEVFTKSVHCIPAKCPTLEEDTRIEEELIDKEEGDELKKCRLQDCSTIYQCPICEKRYLKKSNFLKHMENGVHNNQLEHESLTDYVLKSYAETMDNTYSYSREPLETVRGEIEDQSTKYQDQSLLSINFLEEGWAIRARRRNKRFSEAQKSFMKKYFDRGEESGQKIDAAQVAKLMKTEKKQRRHPDI